MIPKIQCTATAQVQKGLIIMGNGGSQCLMMSCMDHRLNIDSFTVL
jgi:hypothetical protein